MNSITKYSIKKEDNRTQRGYTEQRLYLKKRYDQNLLENRNGLSLTFTENVLPRNNVKIL
jgi:hypothetical protein